ncbi:CD48 antigen [Brachyistius frenatus]|uniref:CD48 antigen n=1 Tax=Brachyistius frenatus TaxID=100188 RepID=UPI0037E76948
MCRLTLFIIICEVVLVKAVGQVQGYLGDNITLTSGADPSWTLSKIEWSIFTNTTWIATYHAGDVNTNRVFQFKGRLNLNTTSGDLIIRNLTTNDAMEYTVEVLNSKNNDKVKQIQLIVNQRLQIPTIQTLKNEPREENCMIELKCSSPDKGVTFSWNVFPRVNTLTTPDGTVSHLFAYLDITTGFVNFTCTTSRKTTDVSGVVKIQVKCNEDKPQSSPQPLPSPSPSPPPPHRNRYVLTLVIGFFAGCAITAFIICYLGGQIKAAWQHLLEKLCAAKDSS